MNNLPITVESQLPAETVSVQELVDHFLSRRSERTQLAYKNDLADFAGFLNVQSNQEALQTLISVGPGRANALALQYKNHLIDRAMSANTVNRRLATLRSAIKLANTLGIVTWSLRVENERVEVYRDTTGTDDCGFKLLLDQADKCRNRTKGIRDRAILRLLWDRAFRRGEIAALDLSDVDLDAGTVLIQGKGKTQQKAYSLPEETHTAVAQWILVRDREPGPLFTNVDRAGKGDRLTGSGIYRMVRYYGKKVGITARPHGLRHGSITKALDLTNGNVRAVREFSRHANLQTLTHYDDNRQDLGGQVARMVAQGA